MKKLKFDQIPDSLGKVLTPEEMKAISMASNSQGNCKCTLYMTDDTTQTISTYSYDNDACKDYCERQCDDFKLTPYCYKVGYSWSEMAAEASPAQEAVPQEAAREAMAKGNHCAFATRTAR